jgi:hypothetical protein
MEALQLWLGVKVTHLLGGMAGGSVYAILMKGTKLESLGYVVVGMVTAAYMTVPVYAVSIKYFSFLPVDNSTENATGFLLGVTAMYVCRTAINMVRKWSRNPAIPTTT